MNFSSLTHTDFESSPRASSITLGLDQDSNDGEKNDDDDEINVNIDIKEIMQQIISLKEDNFELQQFPIIETDY